MSIAENFAEKLIQIAENEQKVYDTGYIKGEETGRTLGYNYGWNDGLQQGTVDGKKAEYDRFWDLYQQSGKKVMYSNAFSGCSWNENTFYPKYDIISGGYSSSAMFSYFAYNTSIESFEPFDLETRLLELGLTFDVSQTINTTHMFQEANIGVVPELNFSNLANLYYLCNYSKINTFRKIKVSETTKYTSNFTGCANLTNITFEGVIGQDGLNFNWSPLSVASMKSIISCLKDLTGTDGEGVYTIKFNETCWAALEADSTAPDGGTWADHVQSLGWVI